MGVAGWAIYPATMERKMPNKVHIHIQDHGKNWIMVKIIENINDQYVRRTMEDMKRGYPNKRVKATTSNGALIDIMD